MNYGMSMYLYAVPVYYTSMHHLDFPYVTFSIHTKKDYLQYLFLPTWEIYINLYTYLYEFLCDQK